MTKKTIDQRRAEHAWKTVELALKIRDQKDQKKFGGQAKKLPARVVTSGLGQALAFLKAKNYAPLLLQRIADWVLNKRQDPKSERLEPGDDALLQRIVQGDSDFLRRATDEVLAYILWVNRFAEANGLSEDEE
jgi:CRISPR-associated protein Cmr5